MKLKIFATGVFALLILTAAGMLPASAQSAQHDLAIKCTTTSMNGPFIPPQGGVQSMVTTYIINLGQGSVTEQDSAGDSSSYVDGQADDGGRVLHLTVTDTSISINLQDPSNSNNYDDLQISRINGQGTEQILEPNPGLQENPNAPPIDESYTYACVKTTVSTAF